MWLDRTEATSVLPKWRTRRAFTEAPAALILLIGSLTVWVKRQSLEPEAWTNTSTELIRNEDIQVALATALSDRLIERGDIQARLEERLPGVTQPLAAPIAGLINQNVQPAALRLVQSPRVQTIFEGIVTRASTTLIAMLEGNEGGRVTTAGGEVVLDLNPLLQRLSDRLITSRMAVRFAQEVDAAPGPLVEIGHADTEGRVTGRTPDNSYERRKDAYGRSSTR